MFMTYRIYKKASSSVHECQSIETVTSNPILNCNSQSKRTASLQTEWQELCSNQKGWESQDCVCHFFLCWVDLSMLHFSNPLWFVQEAARRSRWETFKSIHHQLLQAGADKHKGIRVQIWFLRYTVCALASAHRNFARLLPPLTQGLLAWCVLSQSELSPPLSQDNVATLILESPQVYRHHPSWIDFGKKNIYIFDSVQKSRALSAWNELAIFCFAIV